MKYTTNLLNKVEAVELKVANTFAASVSGEQFHKGYKKYPKLFTLLTRSDMATERELKKYFKGLTTRVHDYINWQKYSVQLMQASPLDWITADWSPERLLLKVLLTKTLTDALEAGGNYTELDTNIDIGWNINDATASKFMTNYTLKLAGGLTDTTIDRVKASLANSFSQGFNNSQATEALLNVIDDPKRAATIAHTEAVRAFTQGRLAVAEQIGADRKRWDATGGACEICAPLDGTVVGLDDEFEGSIDEPPAHPNCRCLVNILMPNE
jgi:hypothetical protein